MFEDKNISSTGGANNFIDPASNDQDDSYAAAKKKKLISAAIIAVLALGLIVFLWWLFTFVISGYRNDKTTEKLEAEEAEQVGLGVYLNPNDSLVDGDGESDSLDGIEYLSFADFYKFDQEQDRVINFKSYSLPVNVKVDIANYYDISRKINLDANLDDLNNHGFSILNNPWPKEADDFYTLNEVLDSRQIPLFLTADFISYYYQSILKLAFKEIEEGVFYESLWNINQELYEKSRLRYEAHLAQAGNINDRVLEAERLETAFFAVSLELLKPDENQIETNNRFASGLFNEQEQKKFSFTIPAYLNDDVLSELALIKGARENKKSPVLLYDRNYRNFVVPSEYRDNARLNNFYLAAAWLNSTFPLNYRDDNCPDCLLDKDDWRINFIASNLIAHDFSVSQNLKNEWARVYKSLSFFKGLRDAWNYIDYREGFEQLFSQDGDIQQLFAENNLQSDKNLESLRQKLLERQALFAQGGYDQNSASGKSFAGLQFLADFYWPNDFIFSSLRYPKVGEYTGGKMLNSNNLTACKIQNRYQRCQGSSQDILSLIYPAWQSAEFLENSNYVSYAKSLEFLRPLAIGAMENNLNNYWASLYLWNRYIQNSNDYLPAYLQGEEWKNKMANTALAAWIDMQLPMDKLSLRTQSASVGTLSSGMAAPDYAWVEPNLEFFDRIIAHNDMVIGMFQALNISGRSNLAINYLKESRLELSRLRDIAIKQAKGEDLNENDTQMIRDFAKMYSLEKAGEKNLTWSNDALKVSIKQRMEMPQLLILAHPVGDKLVFAVGPIFNHRETK